MSDFNLERLQGETRFRHLVRLSVGKLSKEHSLDWLDLVDMFGLDYSAETLRKKSYGWKDFVENEELERLNAEEDIAYKETNEILSNGSHKSDKLIRMNAEQLKDVDYLLKAHGFDKKDWQLVNARNNIWNVYSTADKIQELYSSKITVKPRVDGFDLDKLLELVTTKRDQIIIEKNETIAQDKLLEISLFDMHFGISTLEDYCNYLLEIVHRIRSRKWDTILIVVGQDLLHNDNFRGQTANGTNIEKTNMEVAFDEALQFYETIFKESLENADNVEAKYVKGNHDESLSYGLFRVLMKIFPQAKFDSSLKQRKAFTWKKVFIGLTHGDKGVNRITENFMSEFGKLIAEAEIREVHSGHLHTEITKDKFGIVQRTLATANKTDEWHEDNGFVGANKRFQLFEYSQDSLDAIYYIQFK
ncbi:hypothetical protein Q7A53_06110 [Halobacillus rhizosphaerae]|uniref:hypothetical protein n=1 Tax=Halobacillus rhizosphaerae TaxID=3064889 RepID=UPI00398B7973